MTVYVYERVGIKAMKINIELSGGGVGRLRR